MDHFSVYVLIRTIDQNSFPSLFVTLMAQKKKDVFIPVSGEESPVSIEAKLGQ